MTMQTADTVDREQSTDASAKRVSDADWAADLTTNTGFRIVIRPARPSDEAALAELYRALSADDLRHRFLSAVREVAPDQIRSMVRNDDPHSVSLLAFEFHTGRLIATAMLVTGPKLDTAEFAVATRPDRRSFGVSWTLLEHLIRLAKRSGIRLLTSTETHDDARAIKLEREMGFRIRQCPDDSTLMIAEKILN